MTGATREIVADGETYVAPIERYRENVIGRRSGPWSRLLHWAKISNIRRRTRRLMEEAGHGLG